MTARQLNEPSDPHDPHTHAADLPDPIACAERLARLAEAAARMHRLISGDSDQATTESCPGYANEDGSIETYPMRTADDLLAQLKRPAPVPPAGACAVPAPAAA